jgi:glucan biosynthesis protein
MDMAGDFIRSITGLGALVFWLAAAPAFAVGGAAEPVSFSTVEPELTLKGDPVARVAYATVTLPGAEAIAGDPQRVVIHFAGGDAALFGPDSAIEPVVTLSGGTLLALTAEPHDGGWRLTIDFDPADEQAIELRAFLRLQSQALTETWSWHWSR